MQGRRRRARGSEGGGGRSAHSSEAAERRTERFELGPRALLGLGEGLAFGHGGVFVPRVMATRPDHAALVIEDYGDEMLEGRVFALAEKDDFVQIRALYKHASEIIARFLQVPRDDNATWCKRSFDEDRFIWELNFFMQKE